MALWLGLSGIALGLSLLTNSRCIILNDSQLECTHPYLLLGALALIAGAALIYHAISSFREVAIRKIQVANDRSAIRKSRFITNLRGTSPRRWGKLRKEGGVQVQHIRSRVKHPQTGEKIERVFGTTKSKLRAEWPDGTKRFRDLDDMKRQYNENKPHISLDFENAETPAEAFVRTFRLQEKRAFLKRNGSLEK